MLGVLCAIALVTCAVRAATQPLAPGGRDEKNLTIATFSDAVAAYVKLHGAPRPDARQGNIFTPGVTVQFHGVIQEAFRGSHGRDMRRTIREAEFVTIPTLHVNDVYPDRLPMTTMPPTLLRRLPVLPAEVIYRIAGRSLMLQDVRTSVIVDFMPDAIPAAR
jgi:hypothetical protein